MVATLAESSSAFPSETPDSNGLRVGASFTALTVWLSVTVALLYPLVVPRVLASTCV